MSGICCALCSIESTILTRLLDNNGEITDNGLSEMVRLCGGIQISNLNERPPLICNDCVYKASVAYKFHQECQDPTIKSRLSSIKKIKLDSRDATTQTESQKLTIIVNWISGKINEFHLRSIFSEYGTISHIYLCPPVIPYRECFARITFIHEQGSINAWEDSRNKRLKFKDEYLTVTPVSENYSPIDVLSDDNLHRIFLFISDFEDKLDLEKVCQRWKKIALLSWGNVTTLDNYEVNEPMSIDKLQRILDLCCRSLKDLSIDISEEPVRLLKMIETSCENLRNLVIRYGCVEPTDELVEYLNPIFIKNRQLRRILLKEIDDNSNFDCLNSLPEDMMEIHLSAKHCSPTRANSLMNFSNFRHLKVLYLYSFAFDDDSLTGLENLNNLKHLSIINSTIHSNAFERIQNLSRLEHLEIPYQQVSDNILSIIIRNNQNLKYLDISNMRGSLTRTFQYIVELPKLECLIMRSLHDIDCSHLVRLRGIHLLDCRDCPSITDWELMTLIDCVPSLRDINVSGCSVTTRLIVSVEESKKRQNCNKKLSMTVADQKMIDNWRKMADKSGKLVLCKNYEINGNYFDWSDWAISDEN